jgi:TnpA family transposase
LLPGFLHAVKELEGKQKTFLIYFGKKEELNNFRHLKEIEIEFIEAKNNRKEEFFTAFETARKKALNEKFDSMFFIDSRILPSKQCLNELIKQKKEIIAPGYFTPRVINLFARNTRVYFANFGEIKEGKSIQKTLFDALPSRIIQADFILLNAVLVSKKALGLGLDFNHSFLELDYALKAEKAGIELFVDSGNICRFREHKIVKIE